MINASLAVFVVALILLGSEFLWRKKIIKGEYARKFIHITIGCFVATMPFWISYGWIIIFALGATTLSLINHYHRFFKAGLSVKRRSYGDLFLAVAMLICAAIQPEHWIFMVAILHVSLADGLAAVIGTYYINRKGKVYKVFGQKKTIVGTIVFMITSFCILLATIHYSGLYVKDLWSVIILLPLVAAATENIGIYGTDNLFLPILVMFSLLALKP